MDTYEEISVADNKILDTDTQIIYNLIYMIREKQVMLDSDLSTLYQVETKRLNEAMKRNKKRFPEDFCFQLTEEEYETLRSQIATSKLDEIDKCFGINKIGDVSVINDLVSKAKITS